MICPHTDVLQHRRRRHMHKHAQKPIQRYVGYDVNLWCCARSLLSVCWCSWAVGMCEREYCFVNVGDDIDTENTPRRRNVWMNVVIRSYPDTLNSDVCGCGCATKFIVFVVAALQRTFEIYVRLDDCKEIFVCIDAINKIVSASKVNELYFNSFLTITEAIADE